MSKNEPLPHEEHHQKHVIKQAKERQLQRLNKAACIKPFQLAEKCVENANEHIKKYHIVDERDQTEVRAACQRYIDAYLGQLLNE